MADFCMRLEIEMRIKQINAKYVLSLSRVSNLSLLIWTERTSVYAADIFPMLPFDPKLMSSSSSYYSSITGPLSLSMSPTLDVGCLARITSESP